MPIGTTKLRDGRHIPNLAFGSGSALRGKDAYNSVAAALRAGFRHVDTAQLYYNENSVGKAINDWLNGDLELDMKESEQHVQTKPRPSSPNKRKDLWLTTKYRGGDQGPYQELKESLKRLQLEYVDLYLIHNPALIHGDLEDVWREMERTRKEGIAKSIGVSNFDANQLSELLKIAKDLPVINQIRLHPYIYKPSIETLKLCAENQIVVEAYGSLFPITQYPEGPVTGAITSPQRRLGATAAQVLFLWVRAKGAVVVTTTNREERLQEYLGLGKLGSLLPSEVKDIDIAGRVSNFSNVNGDQAVAKNQIYSRPVLVPAYLFWTRDPWSATLGGLTATYVGVVFVLSALFALVALIQNQAKNAICSYVEV
ncbi:hypothetical protein FRC17_006805 [Serendipita sp. 399]|nr:hypothetical protein FRC17_006805 [Serendipita sp. 399]